MRRPHFWETILCIVCVWLNLPAAGAGAAVMPAPYTPEDIAEWEVMCSTHPQCAAVWSGLKVVESELNSTFDNACAVKTEKCQAYALSRAFETLNEFAVCDGIVLCIGHINVAAAAYEKRLITGIWCASNLQFCVQLKARREQRLAQGKAWCDEYHELCRRAIKLRVEVWGRYQLHLAGIRRTTQRKHTE